MDPEMKQFEDDLLESLRQAKAIHTHKIQNHEEYKAALAKVSPWFDKEPEPGTSEARQFDEMISLIQAYEAKHFPMPPSDPLDAKIFRDEQS